MADMDDWTEELEPESNTGLADNQGKPFEVPNDLRATWTQACSMVQKSSRAQYQAECLREMIDRQIHQDWGLGIAALPPFCPNTDEFNDAFYELVCKQAVERMDLVAQFLEETARHENKEAATLMNEIEIAFKDDPARLEQSQAAINEIIEREKKRGHVAMESKVKFLQRTLTTQEDVVKAVRTIKRAPQRARFADFQWNWTAPVPVKPASSATSTTEIPPLCPDLPDSSSSSVAKKEIPPLLPEIGTKSSDIPRLFPDKPVSLLDTLYTGGVSSNI